jgi:hypothetical protein
VNSRHAISRTMARTKSPRPSRKPAVHLATSGGRSAAGAKAAAKKSSGRSIKRAASGSARRREDPVVQHAAREVLEAANQLIEGIDTWHRWFNTLRSAGDADPGIALRCHEDCYAAVQALCSHRVNVAPFNRQTPEEIFRMLPPLPDWSMGGVDQRWNARRKKWVETKRIRWQESPDFLGRYYGPQGRSRSSLHLRAAAAEVRMMVKRYPLSVLRAQDLGQGASAPKTPDKQQRATPKRRVRANALQIFPQGTEGLDPKLVAFAQHMLAGRDGKRSDNEIARELTGETQQPFKKARSLLARCRKLRKQGRLNF